MRPNKDLEDYWNGPPPILSTKRGELRIQLLNIPDLLATRILGDIQEIIQGYTVQVQYSFLKEETYDGSATPSIRDL